MRILLVDDEQVALTSVRRLLKRRGFSDVEICGNGRAAIELIKNEEFDLVLLDLLMPEIDGIQVLEATKAFRPATEFIMLTAVDDAETAVKAIHLGAYDYLVKPVENARLCLTIERAYERRGLLSGLAGAGSGPGKDKIPEAFAAIVTQDRRFKELLAYARVMAAGGVAILITGESGTGKELLARGIHRAGPNPAGPFVAVNVSSCPEALFESQFFGYRRGAFTGATRDFKGFFEQADGGTLFLDEIGELPVNQQAKLLRVLEEKTVCRLGDSTPIPVDVRIVSATNMELERACQEGRFRLDLLYRLKSAQVHLPPLRERNGDIALLAAFFLKKAARQHQKEMKGFSPEALTFLRSRDFPGNVRELAQMIEQAVLVAGSSLVRPHHLAGREEAAGPGPDTLCSFKENADKHLLRVLQQTGGDRHQAARILGVTVRQIQRRVARMRHSPHWQPFLDDL